jgi:nitric oxide reductase large subunit
MTPLLNTLAFILIVITSMTILVFRDWRINAIALGLQYLSAFALVTRSWPLGMAVVKLIVGWMATAALALTCIRQKESPTNANESSSSFFFRGFAGLLVILVIFVLAPKLQESMFPNISLHIIQGGIMLIGISLMQLGTTSSPYLIILSLLSLFSGFEMIHAALELSTLLTGLLAIVNLGLALVGVFFMAKFNADSGETTDA